MQWIADRQLEALCTSTVQVEQTRGWVADDDVWAFLASGDASYFSGVDLVADGGMIQV